MTTNRSRSLSWKKAEEVPETTKPARSHSSNSLFTDSDHSPSTSPSKSGKALRISKSVPKLPRLSLASIPDDSPATALPCDNIDKVSILMRDPKKGVPISDHKRPLKSRVTGFKVCKAIEWFLENKFATDTSSALSLGSMLQAMGEIQPVDKKKQFSDLSAIFFFPMYSMTSYEPVLKFIRERSGLCGLAVALEMSSWETKSAAAALLNLCGERSYHILEQALQSYKLKLGCDDSPELMEQLLREDSPISVLTSSYVWDSSIEYISVCLFPAVDEILKFDKSIELEEHKRGDPKNAFNLFACAETFLKSFMDSIHKMPIKVRIMLKNLVHMLSKYPDSQFKVMSSCLLLRFVNALLVAPEEHGFPGELTVDQKRKLLMVAKLIQGCSTNHRFAQPAWSLCNGFVDKWRPIMQKFFAAILEDVEIRTTPRDSSPKFLSLLANFVAMNKRTIMERIETLLSETKLEFTDAPPFREICKNLNEIGIAHTTPRQLAERV